ncbi:aminotransferase class I/II-fold pyridoxal phosphate-dependent enzyme [Bacillus salipaludis]|uniref:aminotransferase class I/II-fold pyridoxal phosphate-dependent enzyme n=1 Tax=Bacillus salipaludis TaxID=2547811 RepID=UPI003D1DA743
MHVFHILYVLESHYYPDLTCLALRQKLGNLHGLDPENYVIANGADNIINLVIASYVDPGEEVVYCIPTLSEYNKNTLLVRGIPVQIPTTLDHKFDLKAILGATVGFLRFGKIARRVAEKLKPFGVRLIAYAPSVPKEIFSKYTVESVSFNELFRQSTILSLHIPFRPENKNMIGYEQRKQMPKGSFIVNTSRGGLINAILIVSFKI